MLGSVRCLFVCLSLCLYDTIRHEMLFRRATVVLCRCSCAGGYTGPTCEDDLDECASDDACLNGATCLNTVGSHACSCPATSHAQASHQQTRPTKPLIFYFSLTTDTYET